jgi:hypothetical protein
MKKILVFLMGLMLMIGISSCTCTRNEEFSDSEVAELVVENVISTDRQAMYLAHGGDYRWYETGIQLVNWLDEENDGAIDMVVNVFQTIENRDEQSFDTFVYKYQHFADGTVNEEGIHGFWIEDWPLEEEVIKVTFAEAFEKVQEVNYPKPHTRQVVLRKPIGPNECNPQWIFGNLRSQIWVDAVTGEVATSNPAFKGTNLGTPLGEWP